MQVATNIPCIPNQALPRAINFASPLPSNSFPKIFFKDKHKISTIISPKIEVIKLSKNIDIFEGLIKTNEYIKLKIKPRTIPCKHNDWGNQKYLLSNSERIKR